MALGVEVNITVRALDGTLVAAASQSDLTINAQEAAAPAIRWQAEADLATAAISSIVQSLEEHIASRLHDWAVAVTQMQERTEAEG